MPTPITVTYSIWPTSDQVANAAAQLLVDSAQQAVTTRGVARIAVSGGNTPKAMFALLAAAALRKRDRLGQASALLGRRALRSTHRR